MKEKSQKSKPNLLHSEKFQMERVEEFLLDEADVQRIQELLSHCFPDYPKNAIFFNQLPSFRYLAQFDQKLIGHLGVDFRVINNGGQLFKVLCISDVCVHSDFRDQLLASEMLHQLEKDAQQKQIEFAILIANDSSVYRNLGYKSCSNSFRWMMIQHHKSLGIVQRNLGENGFMVKSISDKNWSDQLTDLLGPIF